VALEIGQNARALYRATRAVKCAAGAERARALVVLAKVRIALGDHEGAAADLDSAIEADPARALDVMEVFVLERGLANGEHLLGRVLESRPEDAEIRALVRVLDVAEVPIRRPELAALAAEIRESGADLSRVDACRERLGKLLEADPLDPESILVGALLPEDGEAPEGDRSRYVAQARGVWSQARLSTWESARLTVLLRRYEATAGRLLEALRAANGKEDSER
jgi:tetratricopeptide (TPR) repeat protein